MAYVYIIMVDNVIRYIGKGTGDRMRHHMKKVRSIARRRAAGESVFATLLYNRLTKAWLSGSEIEFEILLDGLTDEHAFDVEADLISRSKGLWNMAPGGTGFSSQQWDDPTFRASMKKREQSKRTPEYRNMRSKIAKSLWNDPVWRANWLDTRWPPGEEKRMELEKKRFERKSHAGKLQWRKPKIKSIKDGRLKWKKPRVVQKSGPYSTSFTSESAKIIQLNVWRDPIKRAERLELFKSPEYRARVSIGVRDAHKNDPTIGSKISKGLAGKPKTQEHNHKISERAKERWADPVFRAKMNKLFNDPATKERRSEARRKAWAKRRASN